MKTSFSAIIAVVFSAFIFSSAATASPELVSSDETGTPFVSLSGETVLDTLGISEDGRYVLLRDGCKILRKDRETGELLTVLESEPFGLFFCDAQMSDDGNLVASSPRQTFSIDCTEERPDEDGVIGCYLGDRVELAVKNIATGQTSFVTREYISNNSDIARIPGQTTFQSGLRLIDFAGDGGHAVVSDIGVQDGIASPVYRLIDVNADSSVRIDPPVAENETLQITSVSISDDGNRFALIGSIVTPPNPPEGTYCPGPTPGPGLPPTAPGGQPTGPSGVILCGQTGRCDTIGVTPGVPVDPQPGDSWWNWGYTPECRPQVQGPDVFIWDRAQNSLTALNANEGEGVLPDVNGAVISGDGNAAAWLNRAGICSELDANTGGFVTFPCDADEVACEGDNCVTQLYLANLLANTRELITAPNTETDVCAFYPGRIGFSIFSAIRSCRLELSDDGSQVLYPRTVNHPFGGDWSVQNPGYALCIDRVAWETTGEAIDVPCSTGGGLPGPIIPGPGPTCGDPSNALGLQPCGPQPIGGLNSFLGSSYVPTNDFNDQYNKSVVSQYSGTASNTDGPIIGIPFSNVTFSEPLTWHLYDANTGHTSLVSINDANQLFHASGAILAGNGGAWAFDSRDPRLQDVPVEPLAATEAELDEACFWSPAGQAADLRIMTNDNVTTDVGADEIEYPGTPVLCPIPDPAFARHVFADELDDVNVSVMTFRRIRGWQQTRANMQTWFGNFSPNDATLVAITVEINGLSSDSSVDFGDGCEVYPPAGDDDSWFIRCDVGALQDFEMGSLQWHMISPETAFIEVKTSIEANEHDLRPRWNTDTDRVVIWKPRFSFWDWFRSLF